MGSEGRGCHPRRAQRSCAREGDRRDIDALAPGIKCGGIPFPALRAAGDELRAGFPPLAGLRRLAGDDSGLTRCHMRRAEAPRHLPESTVIHSLSLTEVSHVIALATAPAFLLGCLVALMAMLISRMARVVDRAHALENLDAEDRRAALKVLVPVLRRRAQPIHYALGFSILSGIVTALLVVLGLPGSLAEPPARDAGGDPVHREPAVLRGVPVSLALPGAGGGHGPRPAPRGRPRLGPRQSRLNAPAARAAAICRPASARPAGCGCAAAPPCRR